MPETDDNQLLRGFIERQSDANQETTQAVFIIVTCKAAAVPVAIAVTSFDPAGNGVQEHGLTKKGLSFLLNYTRDLIATSERWSVFPAQRLLPCRSNETDVGRWRSSGQSSSERPTNFGWFTAG
jgi:hypothetical protein